MLKNWERRIKGIGKFGAGSVRPIEIGTFEKSHFWRVFFNLICFQTKIFVPLLLNLKYRILSPFSPRLEC